MSNHAVDVIQYKLRQSIYHMWNCHSNAARIWHQAANLAGARHMKRLQLDLLIKASQLSLSFTRCAFRRLR